MKQHCSLAPRPLLVCLLLGAACAAADDDPAADPESGHIRERDAQLAWPVLRPGQSSYDVTAAQYLLRHRRQSLGLTGTFDDATRAAVESFQRARELGTDGLVGAETWEALLPDVVQHGDTGDAVGALQYLLLRRHGLSLAITGTFGETTELRVREFQTRVCLTSDGVVGLLTWNALIADVSYCSSASAVLALHVAGVVTLLDFTSGSPGSDPLSNIRDAASGRPALRSQEGGAPGGSVSLGDALLEAMTALAQGRGHSYTVTSIAGGVHSSNSYHYRGRAVDIGIVDGVVISGRSTAAISLRRACLALGAVEALGPDNEPYGHGDHVHCAF
jgi:peptidoglycan hydrolase-like protein with peptidoglycan-binding domain